MSTGGHDSRGWTTRYLAYAALTAAFVVAAAVAWMVMEPAAEPAPLPAAAAAAAVMTVAPAAVMTVAPAKPAAPTPAPPPPPPPTATPAPAPTPDAEQPATCADLEGGCVPWHAVLTGREGGPAGYVEFWNGGPRTVCSFATAGFGALGDEHHAAARAATEAWNEAVGGEPSLFVYQPDCPEASKPHGRSTRGPAPGGTATRSRTSSTSPSSG